MNKKIKQQWCAALNSGDFQQTRNKLININKDANSYCCLGVLTRLYCRAKKVSFESVDDNEDVLNHKVMKWAGLQEEDPTICNVTLSSHNDNGKSFQEIAKMIKENL